jgi:hypothetical protein
MLESNPTLTLPLKNKGRETSTYYDSGIIESPN